MVSLLMRPVYQFAKTVDHQCLLLACARNAELNAEGVQLTGAPC